MIVHKDNRRLPLLFMVIAGCAFYTFLDFSHYRSPSRPWSVSSVSPWSSSRSPPLGEASFSTPSSQPLSPISKTSSLTEDDVLIIIKTGASVLWRRLPIHLVATLAPERINTDNAVIYSDYQETIGPYTAIDVLANVSSAVRASPPLEPYRLQQNYQDAQIYEETSNTEGDGEGPAGGWKLDKFKFLPLMKHAGENWPRVKWYIYTEADTYIFLPNLLTYLSNFDFREPYYLGRLAFKEGDEFAHGGSGFALSRGAWEKSFGTTPDIVQKSQQFTDAHGCGDHILGHVLKEHGVPFGEPDTEDKYIFGFNEDPHWRVYFTRPSWCQAVYSWHHVHNRDIARYYAFERKWHFEKVCNLSPPLLLLSFVVMMRRGSINRYTLANAICHSRQCGMPTSSKSLWRRISSLACSGGIIYLRHTR